MKATEATINCRVLTTSCQSLWICWCCCCWHCNWFADALSLWNERARSVNTVPYAGCLV